MKKMDKNPIFPIYKFTTAALLVCSLLFPGEVFPDSKNFVKFEMAKVSFRKGMNFFNRMHYLAAVEFFRKAVREYPDYTSARDYLARSYLLAGFVDESLRELENYSELVPEDISIKGRINSIRYREAGIDAGFSYNNIILNDIYYSSRLKMYGFSGPVDLTVDSRKNIYITSFASGKVIKIDSNGKGVTSVRPDLDSQLYGIDNHKERLAVSDFKRDVVYFMDLEGRIVSTIGGSGKGEGKFYGPQGLSFDTKGYLYVVDSGNNRVQKFDKKGRFILQFGKKGEYEGELNNPTDITVSGSLVYLSDTGNGRLALFDESGNFIENREVQGVESPRGISGYKNKLLISDSTNGLIIYDAQSKTSTLFNSWEGELGKFGRLTSTIVDRDGYIYSLDNHYEAVMLFSPVEKAYSNIELEITSVDTTKFPAVAFYVNVRGKDGRPLYNLDSRNFRLTEDKARITHLETDYLKKMARSASIMLCVDRSKANRGFHNEIPWVSDFILKKMRKNDSIKLMNFNSEYWEASGFDWSRRRTLRALRRRKHKRDSEGKRRSIYKSGKNIGTTLYNAISQLLGRLNRRGVVLVTDGSVSDDSFNRYTERNIINYAKTHYIPIYIISFREPHSSLVRIARETGGFTARPSQLNSLRKIYDRIKRNEEYRYVLVYSTYKPAAFTGWWSNVKLEVKYKNQQGIIWGGYFVPGK
jgi:DNA-binding beta-propeller fold protein YncE